MLGPLLLTSLSLALAADDEKPLDIKFDGVVFAHYGYDLTDYGSEAANGFGGFDLSRAYAGFKVDKGPHLAVRFLLDAGRGGTDMKQYVFVKNAFLEWKDPAPGLKIQAGMVPTPWTGFYDNFAGIRYISKSLGDSTKVLQTADFGVGAQGNHSKGLLDWHAVVVNGEGYGNLGWDQTLAAQARVTVDPMAKGEKNRLPISGFVSYENAPEGGDAEMIFAGALGYRMKYITFWGEYLGKQVGDVSGGGYSATVAPQVPDVVGFLARYDHFDPDADTAKDASDRIVAGVTHDFVKKTSIALTYERTTAEAAPDDPMHGVFVKSQFGF